MVLLPVFFKKLYAILSASRSEWPGAVSYLCLKAEIVNDATDTNSTP